MPDICNDRLITPLCGKAFRPNRHVAFGLGPHRCIGSHLARLMSEVMVRAVLDRIPDYEPDLDGVYEYRGNPSMTGLGKLPVTFTPRRTNREI
jgi:cytochrome P450